MFPPRDLISIVIPVYNQEKFIGRCLKSIQRQSYKALEIIVVNDGSTDNSQQIISTIAKKDPRVLLVNQANQGEALARKHGYEKATGEWLMFVDHDDMLPPRAIESLYGSILKTNADLVCGCALRKWGWITKRIGGAPQYMINRIIDQPELFERYYVSFFGVNLFPVTLWGKIYRKSVIDNAMTTVDLFITPHLNFGGDEAFNLLLFPFLKSVYSIKENVYLYRWGGLTSGFNRHLPDLMAFSDFRISLLDNYHYRKGYAPLFIEYVNILLSHLVQLIEYKKMEENDILLWLDSELNNRYLVSRMRDFYQLNDTPIPDKCKMAILTDTNGLYSYAKHLIEHNRNRILEKRVFRFFTK